MDRRNFLKTTAGVAATAPFVSVSAFGQGKPTVNLQLGWLLSGNQIGEVLSLIHI